MAFSLASTNTVTVSCYHADVRPKGAWLERAAKVASIGETNPMAGEDAACLENGRNRCLRTVCLCERVKNTLSHWRCTLKDDSSYQSTFDAYIMSLYCVHSWCPGRPEKHTKSPGTGVTDSCELPFRCWEGTQDLWTSRQ